MEQTVRNEQRVVNTKRTAKRQFFSGLPNCLLKLAGLIQLEGTPMARINNLSARLIVNAWLARKGLHVPGPDIPYTDYAGIVRKAFAPTVAHVPFVSRPDAVAYVRRVARAVS